MGEKNIEFEINDAPRDSFNVTCSEFTTIEQIKKNFIITREEYKHLKPDDFMFLIEGVDQKHDLILKNVKWDDLEEKTFVLVRVKKSTETSSNNPVKLRAGFGNDMIQADQLQMAGKKDYMQGMGMMPGMMSGGGDVFGGYGGGYQKPANVIPEKEEEEKKEEKIHITNESTFNLPSYGVEKTLIKTDQPTIVKEFPTMFEKQEKDEKPIIEEKRQGYPYQKELDDLMSMGICDDVKRLKELLDLYKGDKQGVVECLFPN